MQLLLILDVPSTLSPDPNIEEIEVLFEGLEGHSYPQIL